MESLILASLLMVCIVFTVLSAMTSMGYDVKSRGFRSDGPAVAVLPKLGISVVEYCRRRKYHGIVSTEYASKIGFYKVMATVFLLVTAVIAVLLVRSLVL